LVDFGLQLSTNVFRLPRPLETQGGWSAARAAMHRDRLRDLRRRLGNDPAFGIPAAHRINLERQEWGRWRSVASVFNGAGSDCWPNGGNGWESAAYKGRSMMPMADRATDRRRRGRLDRKLT
jgi:hypothetical protein